MPLAFNGKINTDSILKAVAILQNNFKTYNLPICVDFDHVFDQNSPTKCIARSNIDNPKENLFYVTNPSQAVINQVRSGLLTSGKYFSLLPCRSLSLEDTTHYSNSLIVAAYVVAETDPITELAREVKSLYNAMGISYTIFTCEDMTHCMEFIVNGIVVCRVECYAVNEKYIAVATVIVEPTFSYAVGMTY